MNAKQLRAAARELREWAGIVQECHDDDTPNDERLSVARMTGLSDYVLATVRDDDDEPIDEAWAGKISNDGPIHVDKRHYIWPTMAGFVLCSQMDEQALPHIKTRGDFRQLCRLLGVSLEEGV